MRNPHTRYERGSQWVISEIVRAWGMRATEGRNWEILMCLPENLLPPNLLVSVGINLQVCWQISTSPVRAADSNRTAMANCGTSNANIYSAVRTNRSFVKHYLRLPSPLPKVKSSVQWLRPRGLLFLGYGIELVANRKAVPDQFHVPSMSKDDERTIA